LRAAVSAFPGANPRGHHIARFQGRVTWRLRLFRLSVSSLVLLGSFLVAGSAAAGAIGQDRAVSGGADASELSIGKKLPLSISPNGISCPSALNCWVVSDQTANFGPGGGGVLATTDGGAVWKRQRLPSDTSGLFGISCVTTLDCEAVGGTPLDDAAVVGTTNGGATWVAQSLPAGTPSGPLGSISCLSASDCWTVGGDAAGSVAVTSNGGATWTDQTLPSGTWVMTGVSCVSVSDCLAVGYRPSQPAVVVSTSDGGTTWTSVGLPASLTGLAGVSCTSSLCFAVGDSTQHAVIAESALSG